MAESVVPYLTQLLNLHWLRPETALLRCFDCLLVERHVRLEEPSIDLGCGDGTLSYVMAGGSILDYDVFSEVTELGRHNKGADIYDVAPRSELRLDGSGVRHRFTLGIDHKESLVAKARRLSGFYRETRVQDLNRALPFADNSYLSLFANVLYWLDDLDSVLGEWRRILRPGGRLTTFVPNYNFKQKAWLYYQAPHKGEHRYLNFFDRGYSALIHHCYRHERWKEIFAKNGFAIAFHQPYMSDPVMEIWNIGTRPLAPLLIDMANRLSVDDREAVKAEWIDFFLRFLSPIVEGELVRVLPEEQVAFHFYVLEKT